MYHGEKTNINTKSTRTTFYFKADDRYILINSKHKRAFCFEASQNKNCLKSSFLCIHHIVQISLLYTGVSIVPNVAPVNTILHLLK